jgi:DNA (cytosine-5)-methyltransferase 1
MLALLSCLALVRTLRPRLVTLEQTFGLTFQRHLSYLSTLIGDLTQLGYSVRWKVLALCTWGLAQTRKRLIILAAGPGERLPDFPPATHSKTGEDGLRPFTTIRQVLGKVQSGDNLHNPASIARFSPSRPILDADTLLGTVTTKHGVFYYPDGTRNYTLREYACLQGFPRCHRFLGIGRSIKSQIGNAFPPSCVKILYKHLEKWLLEQDDVVQRHLVAEDVVMIDSEVIEPEGFNSGAMHGMNRTIDSSHDTEPYTIDLTHDIGSGPRTGLNMFPGRR